MKYIIHVAVCFSLLLLSGCSDWLDVSSKSEIDGDELFKSEDGFKQALTGVYTLMADDNLYGKRTSLFLPEALAQHWKVNSVTSSSSANQILLYYLNQYDYSYSTVETYIAEVWKKYYLAIAQLNDIIENVNNTSVVFSNNNDKLILGEALGLRAFMHLELLRLFGPIPSESGSTIAIPYVTLLSKDLNDLTSVSYDKVIELALKDLDEAEALLVEYDPIVYYSNKVLNDRTNVGSNGAPADDWQFLRQGRFNYFAVLGTKARLYQWIGKAEEAVAYAGAVIRSVNDDETDKFTLADTEYMESSSAMTYVFYCEHLFGVHNSSLSTNVKPLFSDGTPPLFSHLLTGMNEVFDESTSSDIRYTAYGAWSTTEYSGNIYAWCRKFMGADYLDSSDSYNNRVPLLRLAEMYFILFESLDLDLAKEYLRTYVLARGLSADLLDLITTRGELDSYLFKEFRREFFGEGQMFYYNKRKEMTTITWPSAVEVSLSSYVVPKPDTQIKFE